MLSSLCFLFCVSLVWCFLLILCLCLLVMMCFIVLVRGERVLLFFVYCLFEWVMNLVIFGGSYSGRECGLV